MIVLLAVVLLVLLVGVAVVSAATGVAGGGRRDGDGVGIAAALAVPAAVAAVVVLLLVVVVFGLGGARSGRAPAPERPGDGAESTAAPAEDGERDQRPPVPLEGPPARFDGRVSIDEDDSPLRPLPIVGDLAAGDVVEVWGEGFLEHAHGTVAQCASVDAISCRNLLSILTDGEGRLRVPYRVEGERNGEVLVVEVDFDRGAARLAFGTTPSLAVLTVDDVTATVTIRGAPPAERVTVRRCDDGAETVEACRDVGSIRAGSDGTASVPLVAGEDADARLTLVDGAGNVLAEPVRVRAPVARPDLDVELEPRQLVVGFGIALLLLVVAITLIRTTDWRAPAEAATPFLDAAPLEP